MSKPCSVLHHFSFYPTIIIKIEQGKCRRKILESTIPPVSADSAITEIFNTQVIDFILQMYMTAQAGFNVGVFFKEFFYFPGVCMQ